MSTTKLIALTALSLAALAPAANAAPTFTGDVSVDFAGPSAVIVKDAVIPDVPVPANAPGGTVIGVDVDQLAFELDPATDTLYVGFDMWGIAGDIDDNGDEGGTASWFSDLGNTDHANLANGEVAAIAIDIDEDGIFDLVAGVNDTSDISNFSASSFNPVASPSQLGSSFAWLTPLMDHTGTVFFSPTADTPDLEFTIPNFSAIPPSSGSDGATSFGFVALMDASSIAEDFVPSDAGILSVDPCVDIDNDGVTICAGDCADDNPNNFPGNVEVCDGVDNTCDGNDAVGDSDGDGLDCAGEIASGADPDVPDSDNDGVLDGIEVNVAGTSPIDGDHDNDGIPDGDEDANGNGTLEPGETSPASFDTDGDGVGDAVELGLTAPMSPDTDPALFVPDQDGGATTTSPSDADSDDDGIPDGDEDLDGDGVVDPGETDPQASDSDGDGVQDGTELGIVTPALPGTDPNVFQPDLDPSTTTDPLDDDSDDDGIADGDEDADSDGLADQGETDASAFDTDNDGLSDGVELGLSTPQAADTAPGVFVPDGDNGISTTSPFDDDSDDDGLLDGTEDANKNGVVDADETDPRSNDTDQDGLQDGTEQGLSTPQGTGTNLTVFVPDGDAGQTTSNPLLQDTDGGGADDGVEDWNFDGVRDESEGNLRDPSDDPQFEDNDQDGLSNIQEMALGTEADDPDTDDDGLLDGIEVDVTGTNPLDDDEDDDGLLDGSEDINGDGIVDEGETDPNESDTDGDGIPDGVELGLTDPQGDDTAPSFEADADGGITTTDPLDDDTDDDGLPDGAEDADRDGSVDESETDPSKADTDGDGLQDGQERGLDMPQAEGTDLSVFVPDADAGGTTTNPLARDTDAGGASDGDEDANRNGRLDFGERDPNDPSDDDPPGLPSVDVDEDGLNLDEELALGTDPENPDTDGDGIIDGQEALLGTDPLQAEGLQGSMGCQASAPTTSHLGWLVVLLLLLWRARGRAARAALVAVLATSGVVASGSAGHAQAATPLFDAQRFDPIGQKSTFVRVRDPEQLKNGQWAAGLFLNYAKHPLEYGTTDGARSNGVIDHLIGFDLTGAMGLGEMFQIGVSLPILQLQANSNASETFARAIGGSGGSVGIGDAKVNLGVQLLQQSDDDFFSLSVAPTLVLPTGTRSQFIGSGALGFGVDGALSHDFGIFRVAANLGFLVNTAARAQLNAQPDHELRWGAAFSMPFLEEWEGVLEYVGATSVSPDVIDNNGFLDGGHTPMEVTLGVRHNPAGPLSWGVQAGPGLGRGYGTPDVRAFAWVMYTPVLDADLDPTGDEDADGLTNEDDQCPQEPEDFDDYEDRDGCPDIDNDNDGINDDRDVCRDEPEDKDGFEDRDGCPDPDNDRDGIPDISDACMNKPETPNGIDDTDGCPDGEPQAVVPAPAPAPAPAADPNAWPTDGSLARVRRNDAGEAWIEIIDRVYFDHDKDVIQTRSFQMLDQVAKILKRRPEITLVRVEGHTDSRGRDGYNLDLSQRRANAVMKYIIAEGVPKSRLQAKGFGETQPIRDNASEEGRAKNRRVEFRIVQADWGNGPAVQSTTTPAQ